MPRALSLLFLSAVLCVSLLLVLGTRLTGFPPLGVLLDPVDGLYRTARTADDAPPEYVEIAGLTGGVDVRWDDRGVPHIFADNDLDAVAVLGYVAARDRLFQMDFIPRAASGRLAAALGEAALPADRFLRATGMEWGARKNLERIRREAGQELAVLEAYCRGVNAYLATLRSADLPFEFRLLGYEPDPCTPMQGLRVLQYMNYDLSFSTDESGYGHLRERLGDDAFRLLYPEDPDYSVPIIPPGSQDARADAPGPPRSDRAPRAAADPAGQPGPRFTAISRLLEGFRSGKGSNNWAVRGDRSATGRPMLAGDMHLSVTLPAIWYEAHVVTPTMNSYGVTIPGAPLPVEAYTDRLGWTFTNTGTDQIDHYRLDVDPSTRTYSFEGTQRRLEVVPDTIFVRGGDPVVDTLYYSHWGPVWKNGNEWIAIQWTAHESSRTLDALIDMNRSRSHEEFQTALRKWDSPMQNILYADVEGIISIRSTGYLPVRAVGGGAGLLDGASSSGMWTGRVPFEELPYAVNPPQGFLTSTNQKPTDSTYAYYLGHDWGRTYRSIRIDSLLRRKHVHTFRDLQRYQADVHAVQRDLFVPLLDTLEQLWGRGEALRRLLSAWDGEMGLDRREPIALHFFLDALEELTWDEEAFRAVRLSPTGDTLAAPIGLPPPTETRIYHLLSERPTAAWLDIQSTPKQESASDLLRAALDSAAARLERTYGWDNDSWIWRRRHKIRFNHLIEALAPLGRGPMAYPGYDETLSPASDTLATHSASWRVVVDFSANRPRAVGVYPGGQSGNPFSAYYDLHLNTYLTFDYYELLTPAKPSALPEARHSHTSVLRPASE